MNGVFGRDTITFPRIPPEIKFPGGLLRPEPFTSEDEINDFTVEMMKNFYDLPDNAWIWVTEDLMVQFARHIVKLSGHTFRELTFYSPLGPLRCKKYAKYMESPLWKTMHG
jgi:hypothetical protein